MYMTSIGMISRAYSVPDLVLNVLQASLQGREGTTGLILQVMKLRFAPSEAASQAQDFL